MKVHVNLDVLKKALYHFVVVAAPLLVTQVVAISGHVGRDEVIAAVGGAVVSAWHTCFPGGLADVKALIKKVISVRL